MQQRLIRVLLVALAYGLMGGLVLALEWQTDTVLPLWPAAGLAFGCVMRMGEGVLAGVALGAFTIGLLQLGGTTAESGPLVAISAGMAMGACLQAWAGVWMVRRWLGRRPALAQGQEILLFMALAGPLACWISPALGIPMLAAAGLLPPDQMALDALVWWLGDTMGVVIFGPLTVMALPGQGGVWRGRRLIVAVPSLLSTALIVALFLRHQTQEHQRLQLLANVSAAKAQNVLQQNLIRHGAALGAVRSLFDASEAVTREEFRRFTTSSLQEHNGLLAMSWNLVVKREERPEFERELQRDYGDPNLRIRERRAGQLVPASDAAAHVAVRMIAPLELNREALGYDIASEPSRAQAITAALDSGSARATAPIELVQARGERNGMLVVLPVFRNGGSGGSPHDRREHLRGFVVGVYRLDVLLAETFRGAEWRDLHLRLSDVTTGEAQTLIGRLFRERPPPPAPWRSVQIPVRRRFNEAGRQWQLEVWPTAAYLQERAFTRAPALLVIGLWIAGLMETLLLVVTGSDRQNRLELRRKLQLSLVTASMAHEIKQPLTTILLQAHVLEDLLRLHPGDTDSDQLLETAQGIGVEAQRLSRTVGKIQNLLRQNSHHQMQIDLRDAVEGACLVVKAEAARRGIAILSSGLDKSHLMMGDRDQLQLLVVNLLRNSLEAIPDAGNVELDLSQDSDWITLTVADSGPGFSHDPEAAETALLSSRKAHGQGLGLFLVRIAVENHQGELRFGRSGLGGALVEVRFPRGSRLPPGMGPPGDDGAAGAGSTDPGRYLHLPWRRAGRG